jgi:hypothetical protein
MAKNDIYSKENVQQINLPDTDRATDMKLSDMEASLAKANTRAELNQASIKNQRINMGLITGQAAHQSALDVARINSFTGLYNAKLAEYDREQAELAPYKQLFASTFGYLPDEFGDAEKEMLKKAGLEDRAFKLAQQQKSLSGGGSGTDKLTALKTNLTSQIYSGSLNREAAKAIFQQQYPDQDPNWVYTAAPDSYEQNISQGGQQYSEDDINAYATDYNAGNSTLSSIPASIRGAVLQKAQENKRLDDIQVTAIDLSSGAITIDQVPDDIKEDVLAVLGKTEDQLPKQEESMWGKFKSWFQENNSPVAYVKNKLK